MGVMVKDIIERNKNSPHFIRKNASQLKIEEKLIWEYNFPTTYDMLYFNEKSDRSILITWKLAFRTY